MAHNFALFTCDWNYELVGETLLGAETYLKEHPGDRLRVFDCFGKDKDTARNRMEYSIYRLPDLTRYDGVLIQANEIVMENARRMVEEIVEKAGIPALAVGSPLLGCGYIGINNYQAQKAITRHVLTEHHPESLAFFAGIEDNSSPEGTLRRRGFLDACEEGGIPPEKIRVYYGRWNTVDGNSCVKRMLAERDGEGTPLPDAIISANDEMALGALEELEKNGIKVPEDILLTGFDNVNSAQLSTPRLSTVARDYGAMTRSALEHLAEMADSDRAKMEWEEQWIPYPFSLVVSESCGCCFDEDIAHLRSAYYDQTRFLKNFYAIQDAMVEELFGAEDVDAVLAIVERYLYIFGCERVFLCLNEGYFRMDPRLEPSREDEGYSEQMVLSACSDGGFSGKEERRSFRRSELLPDEILERERMLIFYPLHYNYRTLGYLALSGMCEAARQNLHESIISFFEIALENARKRQLLWHLNKKLDELYVRDALTGLYNRFGIEKYAKRYYEALMEEKGYATVLFIDLDDMKGINDVYGHEAGDAALRATAGIIKGVCPEADYVMRYGGDEFVIVSGIPCEQLASEIQEQTADNNRRWGEDFDLHLSLGGIMAKRDSGMDLYAGIQSADRKMYEAKVRNKAGRNGLI